MARHAQHQPPPLRPPSDLMWVVALDRGHDNLMVREPGDCFQMPKGAQAPWFRPATADELKELLRDFE